MYLGLDLGSTSGWCATASLTATPEYGQIKSGGARFLGDGRRYLRFQTALVELLEHYRPKVVFYEQVRIHLGTEAGHVYGGLRAVLGMECERRGIEMIGIDVGSIKKYATGKGNADKADMIEACAELGIELKPNEHDIADAVWVVLCGIEHGGNPPKKKKARAELKDEQGTKDSYFK